MRVSRFAGAFSLGIALAGAPACKPAKEAECPKKKYEAPDERFVFFASGKTDVPPEGYFAIGYVVAQLDADASMHVLVVGHADQHGKSDANRDISFKRARAVRKVLVDQGVKPARILIAAPHEQNDSTMAQLSRRADLFVYDPIQDEASKRLGYQVDLKAE